MAEPQLRQNFSRENEALINKHINEQFEAFYLYTSASYYFDRHDVSLEGFRDYFLKIADSKYQSAKEFMSFQNQRGGRITLFDIRKPGQVDWKDGKEVMINALEMEKRLLDSLREMHKNATSAEDAQMADFVAGGFISKQTAVIKETADCITTLEKVKTSHGEWHVQH
nr:ferritin 3 [Halisarca dujardinii]